MDLAVASDRSPGIRATLHEAERTLLIAVALVILVVLMFLASFRASIIPVAAVPVALVGSFGVMYLWGFSLNNLSLMALIVATGLVVDDAIVVLENISRHVELGKSPFEAAIIGAKEVGWTLLSMNLSLVAVFISILFMGGIVERLFREFSITLVAAILISLHGLADADADAVLALAAQARRVAAQRLPAHQRPRPTGGCSAATTRTLGWALRHAPLVVCLLLGVMALNVSLYIAAPKSFLPNQDTGQLGGFIRGDDGTSFQVMQPKIQAFRRAVLDGSGGRERGGVHRRRRVRRRHQQRADVRAPQAAARAQDRRAGSRRADQPQPAPRPGRAHAPVRRPGHPLRRTRRQAAAAATSTCCWPTTRSLLRVWAERVKVALRRPARADRDSTTSCSRASRSPCRRP